jgi:fucose 4-O-acetylase-like acetyltransferase
MKERDYSIDIARGFACLAVVAGHIPGLPNMLHSWIYSFHIPLFFIISGMVLKTSDKPSVFIKKKIRGLLAPYLLLNILVWGLESIGRFGAGISGFKTIDFNLIKDEFIGIFVSYRLTSYYYILWFVIALFFSSILAYAILRLINNWLLITLIGLLFIVINSIVWKFVKGAPLSLDIVPLATGYILLGNSLIKKVLQLLQSHFLLSAIPLLVGNFALAIIGVSKYGEVDLYSCKMGGYSCY